MQELSVSRSSWGAWYKGDLFLFDPRHCSGTNDNRVDSRTVLIHSPAPPPHSEIKPVGLFQWKSVQMSHLLKPLLWIYHSCPLWELLNNRRTLCKSLVSLSESPGKLEQLFSTCVPQKAAKNKGWSVAIDPRVTWKDPSLEIHHSKVLKPNWDTAKATPRNTCQGQRSKCCAFAAPPESPLSGCRCSSLWSKLSTAR